MQSFLHSRIRKPARMLRLMTAFAGLHGALGVVMAAIAAHALESRLETKALNAVVTAGYMQLIHAAVLLAGSARFAAKPGAGLAVAMMLIALGAGLFAGAIYARRIGGVESIAILAPIGVVGIILGWILLFLTAFGSSEGDHKPSRPQP